MKRVLTALTALTIAIGAAVAISPAGAETLTARHGNDSILLMERPCTYPDVVKRLEPGVVQNFMEASAVVGGQHYKACWAMVGDAAYVIYEDGDQGSIPKHELKPALML